jgi:hypothetical protein
MRRPDAVTIIHNQSGPMVFQRRFDKQTHHSSNHITIFWLQSSCFLLSLLIHLVYASTYGREMIELTGRAMLFRFVLLSALELTQWECQVLNMVRTVAAHRKLAASWLS